MFTTRGSRSNFSIAINDDGGIGIGADDPSFFIDSPYEARTRSILSKDRKFMEFLETVDQDFRIGYGDLFQRSKTIS